MAEAESLRKFAVQRPKGKSWETLALVDAAEDGRRVFQEAIAAHGQGYVRLIQVDFKSAEALADYDWHLVELHDPFKGKGPPKPTVIAGTERTRPKKGPAHPRPARGARDGRTGRPAPKVSFDDPRPPEQIQLPYATYIAAALFGALAVALWIIWFRI